MAGTPMRFSTVTPAVVKHASTAVKPASSTAPDGQGLPTPAADTVTGGQWLPTPVHIAEVGGRPAASSTGPSPLALVSMDLLERMYGAAGAAHGTEAPCAPAMQQDGARTEATVASAAPAQREGSKATAAACTATLLEAEGSSITVLQAPPTSSRTTTCSESGLAFAAGALPLPLLSPVVCQDEDSIRLEFCECLAIDFDLGTGAAAIVSPNGGTAFGSPIKLSQPCSVGGVPAPEAQASVPPPQPHACVSCHATPRLGRWALGMVGAVGGALALAKLVPWRWETVGRAAAK